MFDGTHLTFNSGMDQDTYNRRLVCMEDPNLCIIDYSL